VFCEALGCEVLGCVDWAKRAMEEKQKRKALNKARRATSNGALCKTMWGMNVPMERETREFSQKYERIAK
jgi:hypothetical protein